MMLIRGQDVPMNYTIIEPPGNLMIPQYTVKVVRYLVCVFNSQTIRVSIK